jgi:hypothetical protein
MRRRGRKAVTPEQEAEIAKKVKNTFSNNPEILKRRSRLAHAANSIVGPDGLTGYMRAKNSREQTLLAKHGRKDFANWQKSAKTWKLKSEEELKDHGDKIRSSWGNKTEAQKKDIIQRRKQTNIEKYGMECPGNAHLFKGYSERAACLFRELDKDGTAEYKPKCREFAVSGKLFDYRRGTKLIEFNGDYWHANPKKYPADFQVGRTRKRSAQQTWDADAAKIALAESHGYQVKVVWESDYKKNPDQVTKECLKWLKS